MQTNDEMGAGVQKVQYQADVFSGHSSITHHFLRKKDCKSESVDLESTSEIFLNCHGEDRKAGSILFVRS